VRRYTLIAAVMAVTVVLAGCLPANPGPTGLYLGKQANIHPVVTPQDKPVTWGSAPPIDDHYGGTLYAGTSIETQDPRPPLTASGNEPLRLWVANPNNGVKNRPAIIWLHGGGFAVGIDSMYSLAQGSGQEYAQRGYVSFSVEYRTDTTLVVGTGTSTDRASLCQWVQDNENPGDPTWEARHDQCVSNIIAAQHDIQGAVRWIRKHAAEYDVDPNKVAVGGFSAGAVTAANLAYRSDVGSIAYFAGDDRSSAASRVQAAIGASGCLYSFDGGPLTDIGAGDAPISFIHSEYDQGVPYDCVANTVTTARPKGLVAELTSYCNEGGHAAKLYALHKDATDTQWTTFLARQLNIYSGMRPPSAAPVCPG